MQNLQGKCDFDSEIVISGISGRFPNSSNLDEFWQNLIEGNDMITENLIRFNVDEYDIPSRMGQVKNLDKFDADVFSVHAKQASILDPRARFLLETTYEAIMDAGINPHSIRGSNTGVFIAGTEGEAGNIWKRSSTKPNMYGLLGNVLSMMANRVSYTFDFVGPSYVIDTACSTSSVALTQALHAIRTGICDAAVVASAHMHHDPISSYLFHSLKMTSKDGKSKVFDATADGYVRAEASVAIYICKKQMAKRSYATLVHSVTNNDGYKEEGITFPSESQQEKVIRQVYEESGVSPLEVDYLEAHGTGTKVGDPEEMTAATKVLCQGRKGPLMVGSVKSNMGHSEPVSGLCGIAKVILSHMAGVLPSNLHYITPNPDIPALHDGRVQIVDKNQPFNVKYVALSSMGFGGTNVHMLLKMTPKEEHLQQWSPPIPIILLCSGRTHEAVETFLAKALPHRQNQGFVALTHELHKNDNPKHSYRGYVVVESEKMEIQVDKHETARTIWFIFTGLGSQWAGMSRDLIKFEAFKKSIEKSAEIYSNNGFDLMTLLKSEDTKMFDNLKNALVSITSVQIALVDLLKSVGIEPDGIIGHSTGEVAASYADGSCTQDQSLLVALGRARAFLESNLPPGTVASVGLTWEDAQKRCPEGVYPAIHNAKENVTIAGSPDAVHAFVKQLESEGIFAKLVRSAAFGFHSPLVAGSGKLMQELLEKVIPEPKPRSKKWLSSSIPEDQWNSDLAKYSSAEYHVNNGLKPVFFYTTLLHTPENAVALEVAPHCFFQSILKQSLPKNVIKLGLIHCKSPDNSEYFLHSLGKCFLAGVNLDASALYEPVQFPISPLAPTISPMIRWDHSATYDLPHHTNEISRQKGIKYSYHLLSEMDSFLEGHSIDGKIVFPATGYLWLVWRFFAQGQGFFSDNHPVVFENVRFERVTLLNKRTETDFLINIFPGSGKFEVSEAEMVVCSGVVRNVEETSAGEMLNYEGCQEIDTSSPYMTKEDFYREIHLRGYGHSGQFQGILEADMRGKWAKVQWTGNWITFTDSIIQAYTLRNESRDLFVPIRIEKVTIDPIQVREYLEANDNITTVKAYDILKAGSCPGLELRGLSFAKFNQRSRQPQPATYEQGFMPYLHQPSPILSETKALEVSLEIIVENCTGSKFIFTEILKAPKNMISHVTINHSVLKFPAFDFRTVNESEETIEEDKFETSRSKVMSLQDAQAKEHSNVVFVDDKRRISDAVNITLPSGFILFKGPSLDITTYKDVLIISQKAFTDEEETASGFYLLRKVPPKPAKTKVISTDGGFNWVEEAKKTLKMLADFDRIYFVSQCPTSGIAGFVKCLVREVTSEKIRCFHAIDQLTMDLDKPSTILSEQIQQDLVFNIYKDKAWGAWSNLSLSDAEFRPKIPTKFAYANALNLGELSSLHWLESPLKKEVKELVEVHYASLNFRDVMLASGKLVQDALTEKTARSDCVLGLEFSGMYQGRRVCGFGTSECLATRIDPDIIKMIDIPDGWTLEEAATIPCVYITVYFALIIRGKMREGESILIHAGSGGVGQAAIQVALSMNCKVFTTVSTDEKREFLKERFPSLTDDCFANSRDSKHFEGHIYKQTNGRGVDLVLNSLAQDKLHASIRCLTINGRFLEIGKFDVFNNTKIGLSILSKGVSISGILADQLAERGTKKEVDEMKNYITGGMKSGSIKPLSYNVFKHNQLEEAFRFMAQGKHIGKVMIKIKEDENIPATIPAFPRTFFEEKKTYVIVGGLGGMGFELVNWMVDRGAKKFILTSRSGVTTSYHEYHIGVWERQKVTIVLDQSDASTIEGARNLMHNAQKLGPIGGIFNVAVVLKDGMFENQTQANFEEVVKCKADATMHLDSFSRKFAPQLDYFVVFSSIVASRGNPGQTNYGYANSVMERICERRKADGLPAQAIQWGAVGEVGVFHRTMKDKTVFGLAPQKLKSCLDTLDLYLQQDRTVVSSFVPVQRSDLGKIDPNDTLVNIAANILGIKDVSKVNPKTPLVDLGMDSLMAAELSQVMQSRVNIQLSQKAYAQMTFEKLAELDAKGGAQASGSQFDWNADQMFNKVLAVQRRAEKAVFKMNSLATSKDTIYLVHPMDGTMLMIEELVSHMEATVYGVECVKEAPLESMEKLAAFYCQKIKEIQPRGPYQIGGYSFGTNVAFEMALQLEQQGETVSLLLCLDGSPRWKFYISKYDRQQQQEWENTLLIGYMRMYKSDISFSHYKEMSEFGTQGEKFNYLAEVMHATYPEVSLEEFKEGAAALLARAECGRDYEASGKVKARTVLVKALLAGVEKDVPYDYGLGDICEGDVEVIGVEGNHYCFYERSMELGIPAIVNKVFK